jgi:hypothetical protein
METGQARVMRDPAPVVEGKRGGPGTGWRSPDSLHWVYRYTSDPDPSGPEWSRSLRPKHNKMFITRLGATPLLPQEGMHEEINHAQDQHTPGVIIVNGRLYEIDETGPQELEETEMPPTPYRLLENPWRLIPADEKVPKGEKSWIIRKKDDLKQLNTDQLASIFQEHLSPIRAKYHSFKSRPEAIEYTWNIWRLCITKFGPGYQDDDDPGEEKPRTARTVKRKDIHDDSMAGKVLTRTKEGIGARRKAGTRRTDSWNAIKDGMTYSDYIKAGGHPDDLNIILRLGHTTLE